MGFRHARGIGERLAEQTEKEILEEVINPPVKKVIAKKRKKTTAKKKAIVSKKTEKVDTAEEPTTNTGD